MKTLLGSMRRRLLGVQIGEASYTRRGFRGATRDMEARLERIGVAFLGGYHAALERDTQTDLVTTLDGEAGELRGFAFEGAAMGLTLLDFLTPWHRTRFGEFLRRAGDIHAYMVHVGAGWVWARLPVNVCHAQQRLDPMLGWLAFDGWGFHEGYFHWPKYIVGQPPPKKLKGYEQRALIKDSVARYGSWTAATSVLSFRPFLISTPLGATIFGVALALPRPTLESSVNLRSTNSAIKPDRFSHSLPKVQRLPPKPDNVRGTRPITRTLPQEASAD